LQVWLEAGGCHAGLKLHQPPPRERGVATHSAMSLKQSVAAALARLAAPAPGDVVLDPVAGGGSLALQAAELAACHALAAELEWAPLRRRAGEGGAAAPCGHG
jgi:23S rRNA G2445 N2-methylase RlmL